MKTNFFDITPKHLAFIMDGNRRWANNKGLSAKSGHKKGAENLITICENLHELGVGYATFYAFSTENWKRDKSEVSEIFNLMRSYIKKDLKKMNKDIRFNINIIGDISKLPEDIFLELGSIKSNFVPKNDCLNITIAINYGSLDEIKRACDIVIKNSLDPYAILDNLDTFNLPPLDLLIRTGGDKRLSNFLLLQSAYCEIYFSDTMWPDFCKNDLNLILNWFNEVKRNYGK